jgi:hypothetical protein
VPVVSSPGAVPPSSDLATVALVLGVLGFATCGILGFPAVVCGHVAEAETRDGARAGRGQAVAGLLLGYCTVIPWLTVGLFWGMVTLVR